MARLTKTILLVTGPEGQRTTVTSERAARRLARAWLGVGRVTETPSEFGWPIHADEDTDQVVSVEVRS